MSQHDYDIANASGAVVRADINSVLDAVASNNGGSSAPSTTFANMWWFDENLDILKQRDKANTAWVLVAQKDGSGWRPYWNGTQLDSVFLTQANSVGQQTIWIPAGAMTARTSAGATSGSIETSTNKVMGESFDFDTASDDFIQFAIQMPKGWDGGPVIFQIVHSHPSTTTNFGVVFFMQAVALANSDALDTAFGTAVSVTDTGGTTDDIFISPESAAITVAGSPGAEEYVIFQVYRDVSDGADTMAVDARLHGIKVHYTTDAVTDA